MNNSNSPVRASRRKFHIIYKTTCLVTGRWYIGMHSTDTLEDGYLGSGTFLWKSIKKYGKDKHTRVVLEHHSDREALSLREEMILTAELRTDPLCMNFRSGGTGNQPGMTTSAETSAKLSAKLKAHYASDAGQITKARLSESQTGQTRSPETRAKMSVGKLNIEFSDEHRAKLSAAKKGRPLTDKQRANHSTGRERPCTVDGITIYPSHSALVKVHGHGKTGGRSPELRYII